MVFVIDIIPLGENLTFNKSLFRNIIMLPGKSFDCDENFLKVVLLNQLVLETH